MRELKYPCHLCKNKDCIHRQQVSEKDFKDGISKYCNYGFENKIKG
jgi:hypothetical protein